MDARLGLVDDMLTYFDRASMACSLEVRVPFLDHELVELAATIPTQHKVRRLQGKHVLRLAAKGRVPDFVLKKRKRGFFNEAVSDVDGRRRRRRRRPPAAVRRSGLRRGRRPGHGPRGRHASGAAGARSTRTCCSALVMLELWMTEYLPRALSTAPALEAVA